ncbi:MAG: class I SAM-dependent methyltransferase [Chlamydiales bacterium]|nr:class I SAM-dependent methyltransferase [Chlamydiales bacterium]
MILLNLRATFFRLFEGFRSLLRYYRNLPFLLNDLLLASHYLFRNPHRESKRFMKERGEKNIYTYGETPLTTLDWIMRRCGILSKDVLYEVGCGSGRTIFWLHHFVKCRVVGIDYQPTFIDRANRIKEWLRLDQTEFLLQDMLETNFRKATAVYLYGTCLGEEAIERLAARFEEMKSGAKVITVSYPLTDYSDAFTLAKQFTARFPWGKAEVYLSIKN